MNSHRPDEEPNYECEWCLATGEWKDGDVTRPCDRCKGTGYRMRFDLADFLARTRAEVAEVKARKPDHEVG
jgi:hypothetical protein